MTDTGLLIVRLVVGLYVAGHGAQKLFGWFGGPGLAAIIGAFGSGLGFRPARLWATSLAASEVVGGLLMAIGLLGPLGPIAVAGSMLGATVYGHGSKGPWAARGGYELAAPTWLWRWQSRCWASDASRSTRGSAWRCPRSRAQGSARWWSWASWQRASAAECSHSSHKPGL
jgi:putative oxidoreductase